MSPHNSLDKCHSIELKTA